MVETTCVYCNKKFLVERYRKKVAKFCSHDCYGKNLKGQKRVARSSDTKKKIGDANRGEKNGMYGKVPWNKGKHDLIPWNKGLKVGSIPLNERKGKFSKCKNCGKEIWIEDYLSKRKKYCSRKCSNLYRTGKTILKNYGKNNYNWKGGTTPLRTSIWKNFKSVEWRSLIFERDNFTCQMPDCDKTESFLNAHHIKKFSDILQENNIKTVEDAENCKELWNINNGITLCKKCHRKIKCKEEEYADTFHQIINNKNKKETPVLAPLQESINHKFK